MIKRVIALFTLLSLLITNTLTLAQNGGQFCVQAYEDRNSSGTRDAGEPQLTRGVSAELLDAQGIVIASALLEDSPAATRAQGIICFQFLPEGQYTLVVSSPDHTATTADRQTSQIVPGQLPTRMEYGAAPISASVANANAARTLTAAERQALIERLIIAVVSALIVMVITALVGVFIYWFGLRARLRPAEVGMTTTGLMHAVAVEKAQAERSKPVSRDEMLAAYGPLEDEDEG